MSLGECYICHGPLCVSGKRIACERCGNDQPDHPMSRDLADQAKAGPPRPSDFTVPAHHNAGGVPDRVLVLERQVRDLSSRLRALEEALGAKEPVAAGGRKGR